MQYSVNEKQLNIVLVTILIVDLYGDTACFGELEQRC